jgi:PAS domain-containing protein
MGQTAMVSQTGEMLPDTSAGAEDAPRTRPAPRGRRRGSGGGPAGMGRRVWYAHAIAVLSVVAATAMTVGVPALREKTSTILFFAAVVVSSYAGGMRPAMLAVLLSAVAWATFVVPPNYAFLIESPGDALRLLLFMLVAVLTSSLYEQLTRAKRDVRKHQARLDLALEAGRMGVWDYDLVRDDFWISPELRNIFGVGDGGGDFSPTYGGFLSFVHPEDRPEVVRAMTTSRENRTDYQLEHRLVRRGGDVRWIATRGRTFVDADGRAERMIGLVVDITDQREVAAAGPAQPPSTAA